MIKVNAAIGRMQPMTLGHLKLAVNVYKQRGIKTVFFIIDTTKPDEKHPFLTRLLWGAYKKIAKNYDEIEDIILVKSADIIKMAEAAAVKGYTIVSLSCGSDRKDAYQKMCSKYAPSVEVIEIHRTDNDISATQVRQAIQAGHKERFEEMTPKEIHPLYDKLKDAMEALL